MKILALLWVLDLFIILTSGPSDFVWINIIITMMGLPIVLIDNKNTRGLFLWAIRICFLESIYLIIYEFIVIG